MYYLFKSISIIIFLLDLFFIEKALATEYLTKAIIEKIEQKKGDVELTKESRGSPVPAKINDEFKPKDYLKTKTNGTATLAFNENSRVFLEGSSSLHFQPGLRLGKLLAKCAEGNVRTRAVAVKNITSTQTTSIKEATLKLEQGEMRIVTAPWSRAIPYCNPVTQAETSCGIITIQYPTPSSIPNVFEPERDASVVIIKHYKNEKGQQVTRVTALTDKDIQVCDLQEPPKCTNFLLGGQSVEIIDRRMGEIIEKDLRVFYRSNPHTIDSRKEVQQEQDKAINAQEERFLSVAREDFLESALTGRERDWNSFDSFGGEDLLNNDQCNENTEFTSRETSPFYFKFGEGFSTKLSGNILLGPATAEGGNPPGKGETEAILGQLAQIQLASSLPGLTGLKDVLRFGIVAGQFGEERGFANQKAFNTIVNEVYKRNDVIIFRL